MRKAKAYKSLELGGYHGPIDWHCHDKTKIVFHEIEFIEPVMTDEGEMRCVRITSVTDLNNPNIDVAVLIPGLPTNEKVTGKLPTITNKPAELWYWEDKFWLKAVDGLGVDYYQKKRYLLYEVGIGNRDDLLASLA